MVAGDEGFPAGGVHGGAGLIRAIVRLNGVTSMPAGSLRREPPKVHVRMMSAPAAR